jgi:hypothetical protein
MEKSKSQILKNKIIVKNNFRISKIGILKFSENINEWKIEATY